MSSITIDQIIPEGPIRQGVYRVFAAGGFLLGAVQVGVASAAVEQPAWLTVSLAVYGFAAAAGFLKAQANVPTSGSAVVTIDDEVGPVG